MVQLIDTSVFGTLERRGLSLLTDNVREFNRVPGLLVRQPAWP